MDLLDYDRFIKLRPEALKEQARPLKKPIIGATLFVLFSLALAWFIHWRTDTPLGRLTRDPADSLDCPPYYGAVSTLGLILWAATTAVYLFAAALLSRNGGHRRQTFFLLCSGLFSLMLGVDDAYLFHESFLPHWLHIPQFLVYGVYALLALAWLFGFSKIIINETNFILLGTALTFFGLSILMDVFFHQGDIESFVEDFLKFTGIVFWTMYGLWTSYDGLVTIEPGN